MEIQMCQTYNMQLMNHHMELYTTNSDPGMLNLITLIENGFPLTQDAVPSTQREFFQYHQHLNIFDSVPLYKERILKHSVRTSS